jgi:hypothetical protein
MQYSKVTQEKQEFSSAKQVQVHPILPSFGKGTWLSSSFIIA